MRLKFVINENYFQILEQSIDVIGNPNFVYESPFWQTSEKINGFYIVSHVFPDFIRDTKYIYLRGSAKDKDLILVQTYGCKTQIVDTFMEFILTSFNTKNIRCIEQQDKFYGFENAAEGIIYDLKWEEKT